jgi:carboxylesterase type B
VIIRRQEQAEAYPDADAETLFELVNSDWLFRMPTLHLAQAHAAAGGKTFLYQVSFEDPPDVVPYPGKASLHIWDQHRFDVLDLRS